MTQEYISADGRRFTEYAAPGVHETTIAMLGKGADAEILDVPAGGGALAQRLVDRGYRRVVCGDLVNSLAPRQQVEFLQLDLNASVDLGRSFDAILCIECIEHLENPFQLLRTLAGLLRSSGELMVSTPNVLSAAARSKYFSAGYLPYFSELAFRWDELKAQQFMGHIMPVPATTMIYAAQMAGLKFEQVETNGVIRRPRFKDRLIGAIVRMASRRYYRSPMYEILASDTLLYGDVLIFKFVKP